MIHVITWITIYLLTQKGRKAEFADPRRQFTLKMSTIPVNGVYSHVNRTGHSSVAISE